MVGHNATREHWAVVLGGSSGLGFATVEKLARSGMHVCVVYRARRSDAVDIEGRFREIEKSFNITIISHNIDAIKCDKREAVLEDLSSVLASSGGTVKVLVHSIAKGNLKPMHSADHPELQSDDFRLTIESMAISLYDWTKAIYDRGLFDRDARIISFTSEGNQKAWPNYAAVSAAKVALEAISRNIALEFASAGIKCNCIQAGVTDTASLRMIPDHEHLKEQSIIRNPNHRLTTPEDVANVVYLLTTDEAKWITGAIIPVDGGEHIS